MLSRARLRAPMLRGICSTLDRQVLKSWQAQYFVHLGLRLRHRAAFGSCLKGWDVVARAAVGPHLPWQAQRFGGASAEIVAGAEYFVDLGLRLRGRGSIWKLSKGLGCCRTRGCGPHLAWHSQHFGDASVKSWQAQYFVHLGLRLRGRGSIWELSTGLKCCRALGCGPPSRQHFGDASAEVVAGAVLRAPGLAFRCMPLFF